MRFKITEISELEKQKKQSVKNREIFGIIRNKTEEMAQKMEVKMSRFENAPWGFRVHGGIDFGSPLTIQKVRPSSQF